MYLSSLVLFHIYALALFNFSVTTVTGLDYPNVTPRPSSISARGNVHSESPHQTPAFRGFMTLINIHDGVLNKCSDLFRSHVIASRVRMLYQTSILSTQSQLARAHGKDVGQ